MVLFLRTLVASLSSAAPLRLRQAEYPDHFDDRPVSRNGGIRFRYNGRKGANQPWLNLSHVLGEEYVGLEEVGDGIWIVYFGSVLLGRFTNKR